MAIGFGHVIRGGAEAAFEIHRNRKIGRVNDGARVREHLVAGDPAVARAVCAGSRVAGGGDRRKAEARQNARRSRVPGVGDDERARPLMERAEGIAFVELSDGHNVVLLRCVATTEAPKHKAPAAAGRGLRDLIADSSMHPHIPRPRRMATCTDTAGVVRTVHGELMWPFTARVNEKTAPIKRIAAVAICRRLRVARRQIYAPPSNGQRPACGHCRR